MKRRLLNLLTTLSLLLCLASLAWLARSLWVMDYVAVTTIRIQSGKARAEVGSLASAEAGVSVDLTVAVWTDVGDVPAGRTIRFMPDPVPDAPAAGSLAKFSVGRDNYPLAPGVGSLGLHFPIWLLSLIFGLLPAARLYRRLRPKHPPGHCRRCGYDLTGNESGVCPECGTIASARPAP
jgi:hypothetical protein